MCMLVQLGSIGEPHTCSAMLSASAGSCVAAAAAAASSTASVLVALPTPVQITSFTASSTLLTCANSTASAPPLSLPSLAALSAVVRLSDGTQRELTPGLAHFALASDSAPSCGLAAAPDSRTSVRIQANPQATCTPGHCRVILTYPDLNATLVASLIISISDVERLVPRLLQHDASTAACVAVLAANSHARGWDRAMVAETTAQLRPLACSLGDYQQLTLCFAAEFRVSALLDEPPDGYGSDGTDDLQPTTDTDNSAPTVQVDVTAAASLHLATSDGSDAADRLSLLPNIADPGVTNRVKPSNPGNYTVTARLGTVESAPVLLEALAADQAVHVTAIALRLPAPTSSAPCGALCAVTLDGTPNRSSSLRVELELEDGSTVRVPGGGGGDGRPRVDLVRVPAVLQFDSSAPEVLGVTRGGEVMLWGSAAGPVRLEVSTRCTADGRTLAASTDAYANLRPRYMDVDLGAAEGPPVSGNGSLAGVQVCD